MLQVSVPGWIPSSTFHPLEEMMTKAPVSVFHPHPAPTPASPFPALAKWNSSRGIRAKRPTDDAEEGLGRQERLQK